MLQTLDTQEKEQDISEEAEQSLLFTANRPKMIMERGEGMYLWDTEGNAYLDFSGGWAVTSLGHSPAVVQDVLKEQSGTLIHSSPAFYNKPMLEFAKLLTDISCFDKVFFASSGAEANEGAIKLARKYGAVRLNGAYEIITLTNSFHGRTLATMSATGKSQWDHLYEPKVSGFRHVPINDLDACFAAISENTCAIMLELVQGEGGIHIVDQSYLQTLRKACDVYGILLIIDEIQTGIGRTGRMFAYEHYGVEPDIMTLGKGIGGGFPLSAMLTKKQYDLFEPGDQGGTYCGQPLAMAVGRAVVQEVIDRKLGDHAHMQGEYLLLQLRRLSGTFGLSKIRGKGLLTAFDLPAPVGAELVARCLHKGLIINSPSPFVIRLMPALTVATADIDQMLLILAEACKEIGIAAS
ncbi:aspartate aminotransferase family protein [Paenibacillus sp. GCM10012307]|uniref:Acetylornithine/succinylornithine family transaminase n=1 Tax=Paenibacillus roseus TaxID=2798579 RepID=A0A934J8G0_9BACL|nr:acetylornithine/succinylornithine family transaminase [Paenibacillus roseus]MBJ6362347.1 acetylornithine/succinylornithine family transaminase [Paenibacillus roseus]